MADGRLQVNVFRNTVGAPQPQATVEIINSETGDTVEEMVTNISGNTDIVNLVAPPVETSLDPNNTTTLPYSLYNVRVRAQGYIETTVSGVQIFSEAVAQQNVFMLPGEDTVRDIDIPEHTLVGDFPPKIAEEEVKPLPPATGGIVLDRPVIPEFVIVHDGVPDDSTAQNYWVPFKDYINNVASCEIFSTWEYECIKANVLAIISFTLNRVYTEWYRSRGYEFTITSSTAYDQSFSYGRNIYSEISNVVDEVFNNFVTRPNIEQPLFTQYCDGKRTTCPNWLSQWGSQGLATDGLNYIDILKNYYGSDIYLEAAQQVQGVPFSFPGEPLQIGSTGPSVRTIQEQLNAISNNYPAIPKVAVDGIYGQETVNAVTTFQQIFGLPQTGIVDRATWYEISKVYVAVMRLAELS